MEKVDELLVTLDQRMRETSEMSSALAQPVGDGAILIDDDDVELAAFLDAASTVLASPPSSAAAVSNTDQREAPRSQTMLE